MKYLVSDTITEFRVYKVEANSSFEARHLVDQHASDNPDDLTGGLVLLDRGITDRFQQDITEQPLAADGHGFANPAGVIENPDRKHIALSVLRHRLKLEMQLAYTSGQNQNLTDTTARATVSAAKHWLGIPKNKRPSRAKLLELVTKELENYG